MITVQIDIASHTALDSQRTRKLSKLDVQKAVTICFRFGASIIDGTNVVEGTMQCDHIFVWSSCESIPMAGALRVGLPYQTARLKKKNGTVNQW